MSDYGITLDEFPSKDWIVWLLSKVIPNEIIHYKKPAELEAYQVITVDASDIVQKGAVKKTWHLLN